MSCPTWPWRTLMRVVCSHEICPSIWAQVYQAGPLCVETVELLETLVETRGIAQVRAVVERLGNGWSAREEALEAVAPLFDVAPLFAEAGLLAQEHDWEVQMLEPQAEALAEDDP